MHSYIYKLETADKSRVYYGSTTLDIKDRVSLHKTKYKRFLAGKSKAKSRAFLIVCDPNFTYEIIEHLYNADHRELVQKEKEYIRNNNCVNYHMKYTEDAIPEEKQKEKIHCECGAIFQARSKKAHMETKRHKKYLEENNKEKENKEEKTNIYKKCSINYFSLININN